MPEQRARLRTPRPLERPAPTLRAPLPQRLPRGASSLPRAVVDYEQRKRLVLAIARVVAQKGYAATTVADIIAEAGVSRATFYQLFEDKEACFLFGFSKLAAAHLDETERQFAGDAPLRERLAAAVSAYLQRVNLDHALARAFIAEAEAATPRSRELFRAMQYRLRAALERWFEEVRAASPGVSPRTPTDFALLMHGLTGYLIEHVRQHPNFDEAQATAIVRYLLAGMGLHGWAVQASPSGS